jgi:hypothetical protein
VQVKEKVQVKVQVKVQMKVGARTSQQPVCFPWQRL